MRWDFTGFVKNCESNKQISLVFHDKSVLNLLCCFCWNWIEILEIMNDEKLIEAVRQNEILYDMSSKQYRRQDIKDKVWQSIAEKLSSTGKTWTNIEHYIFHTSNFLLHRTCFQGMLANVGGKGCETPTELQKKNYQNHQAVVPGIINCGPCSTC